MSTPLHALAHARAGDKGNRLNIALVAHRAGDWPLLAAQVTEAKVLALFAHRGATSVRRFDLPGLGAFNFVIEDVLQGGVNGALNLDGHGKTLSFLLLQMPVERG
ncbi:hypothetical protein [Roseomonas haemaphysalidis]|jgi:hypothetical protein|uniref:AtuA-like ferredoxin-fold domain-containing protein n=1 Tax=Roseomonas haemaphysalidis TaxID=2768162 RepID=A0ABS3KPG7_9PROT|nr:hypothetical protein [Roseomonas haemaphysalidis]MBO1078246.1 hypothetical protein [Roseomonas haemaphysalidis]